jgi:hypothetical protein
MAAPLSAPPKPDKQAREAAQTVTAALYLMAFGAVLLILGEGLARLTWGVDAISFDLRPLALGAAIVAVLSLYARNPARRTARMALIGCCAASLLGSGLAVLGAVQHAVEQRGLDQERERQLAALVAMDQELTLSLGQTCFGPNSSVARCQYETALLRRNRELLRALASGEAAPDSASQSVRTPFSSDR